MLVLKLSPFLLQQQIIIDVHAPTALLKWVIKTLINLALDADIFQYPASTGVVPLLLANGAELLDIIHPGFDALLVDDAELHQDFSDDVYSFVFDAVVRVHYRFHALSTAW